MQTLNGTAVQQTLIGEAAAQKLNGQTANTVRIQGETDHAALKNRDAADQHPIGAISGLQQKLDSKQETIEYLSNAEILAILGKD